MPGRRTGWPPHRRRVRLGFCCLVGRKGRHRPHRQLHRRPPDHHPAAELRLDLDPVLSSTRALAPLIDPNQHSCGTVAPHGVDQLSHPEKDFYIIGAISYGRAPTFLLATGYEQARSVVAALAGDWQAAREIRLQLPSTGVCNSNPAAEDEQDTGCCTSSSPAAEAKPVPITLPLVTIGSSNDSCSTSQGGSCCG